MAIAGRPSRACDVCASQRVQWYYHADNVHHRGAQQHVALAKPWSQLPPLRKHSQLSKWPNPHVHAPPAFDAASKTRLHHKKGGAKEKVVSRHGDLWMHKVPKFITVNIQESPVSFKYEGSKYEGNLWTG